MISRVQAYAIVAVLAVGGFWLWSNWQYQRGWTDGRAALELTQRRAAEQTRERIRDADTGTGDAGVDLDWLRRRLQPAEGR